MPCAHKQDRALTAVAEEGQEEPADRIGHQDVAPPQPEGMHEADAEQHRHPSRVERDPVTTRGRPIHLDGEADPEERGEDRDELARTSQSTSACARRSGSHGHISDGSMYAATGH